MRKKIFVPSIFLLLSFIATAQVSSLPVKEWKTASRLPLVVYITGDGGFNAFSIGICNSMNKSGYEISAINAKSYFYDKKTPNQTAKDISTYLDKRLSGRENQQIILLGYSFGADVAPFIVNILPATIKSKLVSVILLSPETTTDFEIHWMDMVWTNKKRSMNVVAEINKMTVPKTTTIFGNSENDFPVKDIKIKNYNNHILPGGHHFDGNTDEVAKTIIKFF